MIVPPREYARPVDLHAGLTYLLNPRLDQANVETEFDYAHLHFQKTPNARSNVIRLCS
jgi:hypothetical protein